MRVALAFAAAVVGAPASHEVKSLPGWDGALPSKMYSGYLDASATKHLHYILVERENADPATSPTVFWFNGGPGCSSLDGFIYEHGPFRTTSTAGDKLERFNYTWAKVANVVYLEAPVGVGFSYSEDSSDYGACNDDNTADDNRNAVADFFKKFPEYVKNPFYITGESYGGIYVPTLAEAIMKAEEAGTWTGAKLHGIAVGNGCTGTEIGVCGGEREKYETKYLLGTAFIPQTLKDKITSACDFSGSQPTGTGCSALLQEMHKTVGHINLYNVYGECISGSTDQQKVPVAGEDLLRMQSNVEGPDACIDSIAASAYFNRDDVKAALHVKNVSWRWAVCGNAPGWDYQSTRPNLPRDTYPSLVKKFRVTIYNGDWDACVPYTDNEAWTSSLGLDVSSPWQAWTYADGQVGGYKTGYTTPLGDGAFEFVTVRGGRHEVPETAPERAFEMISAVVANRPVGAAAKDSALV
mmetsp:Transcript_36242/g.79110  ORF Transcript_36242/g.79110 Transcript_36242/m.79110 type:complete len:467 (+) Transcript_36242:46-1446(+)|eukprot:CAMPEP_0204336198 /NCGR_PEP_ID=MMETSP0469-20131031/19345_1 /ASSEMBLY_ACC=CAM_ASM_000384 /TAXON_ID=2969 /ORGANISM="Oxyrrhis marina" /LENGTH=466 /DNA_ID=CAMNT_0051320019 /DNA_START=28 /DNA_END=1428 /DNA_ORIENTATION=-